MGKISNAFSMLELLNNGRKYNIKELSDRLEVNDRTIRFYKEELEKAGIFIDTIRGPYGGYVLNQKLLLPNRGFSKYDIQLLKSIYELVENKLDVRLKREYQNLIDKVQGIYSSSKKKSNNDVFLNDSDKEKYNNISKAIKDKNKMLIAFLNPDGSCEDRIIHPCNTFLYDDAWYVSAFCELRSEIRNFRLERIVNYKILEEKYIN
jgi:predicted DNA-binding transcriptional regulator YafY